MAVLRWGLIGAGDIARKRIAPALRDLPNCEFVAVSRSRADLAEDFAREFGAEKWFADWREMVADPGIDAIYIATPVHMHADQTIVAARAGKHVLCEKPMALTISDCDQMIGACQENSVKLGVAYYRRFYGAIERTKQIIASGEIGDVAVAQINAFEYFDPPADDPRRWLLEREKSGGGPMMDFGCHRIEVLTNLFGPIRRLAALESNTVFGRGVEDSVIASFQFESGPIAVITVTHASIEPRDTLDIYGTKGAIHISALNLGEMTIRTGETERYECHPPHPNFHQPLIDDFTNAVLRRIDPLVDGRTGRSISEVVAEIYRGESG